ncbi:MAG: family 16 glycosylhydrolase, partial [Pseudobdellovibrionaceae bacterium]
LFLELGITQEISNHNLGGNMNFLWRKFFRSYFQVTQILLSVWAFQAQALAATTIDNSQSANVVVSGAWVSSSFSTGYVGSNYLHDGNAGKGSKSFTFKIPITAPGTYEISMNMMLGSNRATRVPVSVSDSYGRHDSFINQYSSQTRQEMVSLGIYTYKAAGVAQVVISNAGTSGYVVVDAVRATLNSKGVASLNCANTTDNSKAGNVATGTWLSSTYEASHCGTNYVHDGNRNKGGSTFKMLFPITTSGTYDVELSAITAMDRAGAVPVTIQYSGGSKQMLVNQFSTESGQHWLPLGAYNFTAGSNAAVTISNAGTEGIVTADAIRLVRRSTTTAVKPLNVDGTIGNYSLSWHDEFNGTALDTTQWDFRIDSKGSSTQLPQNVSVSGGLLHLKLNVLTGGTMPYSGSGVITKKLFKYGYYEARFKIPAARGFHTSFWTMRYNGRDTGVTNAQQELDICENDSLAETSYISGVHAWANRDWERLFSGHPRISTPNIQQEFHIWGAEFTPTVVKFYFDGKFTHSVDLTQVTQGDQNIWLTSIAFGDSVIETAALPSSAQFDYVRFFSKAP